MGLVLMGGVLGVQRGKKTIYKNYQAGARGKTGKRSDRRVGGNVDKIK